MSQGIYKGYRADYHDRAIAVICTLIEEENETVVYVKAMSLLEHCCNNGCIIRK